MTDDVFATALAALPVGTFTGSAHGRRYTVSHTGFVGGRATKLVAEALDGSDYISLNLYRLQSGAVLRPCEMPAAKVRAFVADLRPDPSDDGPQ